MLLQLSMSDSMRFAAAIQSCYPQIGPVQSLEPYRHHRGFSGAVIWQVRTTVGLFACKPLRQRIEHNEPPFYHQILLASEDPQTTLLAIPLRQPCGQSWFRWQESDWELSVWRPGHADFNLDPSGPRLANALQALAGFHRRAAAIDSGFGRSSSIQYRATRVQRGARDLIELERALRALNSHPVMDLGWRLLQLLGPVLQQLLPDCPRWQTQPWPLQPILRDFWHDHALFTGEQLTGIIDLETIRRDLVVCDLVRFLDSLDWPGGAIWPDGLEIYQAASGQAWSAEQLAIVPWLRGTGAALGALHWLEWLFVDQRQFDNWDSVRQRLSWLERSLQQQG